MPSTSYHHLGKATRDHSSVISSPASTRHIPQLMTFTPTHTSSWPGIALVSTFGHNIIIHARPGLHGSFFPPWKCNSLVRHQLSGSWRKHLRMANFRPMIFFHPPANPSGVHSVVSVPSQPESSSWSLHDTSLCPSLGHPQECQIKVLLITTTLTQKRTMTCIRPPSRTLLFITIRMQSMSVIDANIFQTTRTMQPFVQVNVIKFCSGELAAFVSDVPFLFDTSPKWRPKRT